MGGLTFGVAVLAWGLLPGWLLLRVSRVPWSLVERTAAAPGLSIALVALAAYAAEILGLPVSPLPVALVIAAFAALLVAARRGERLTAAARFEWPFPEKPAPAWVPWLVLLTPLAVVWQLDTVWKAVLLPPTLHDGLDHANWFRLILETRSLNPQEVAAPPLGPAGEPAYYPWGMHAWAALVASMPGLDPALTFTRAMVAISAMFPLSVYVFAARFTGRGWTAIASAVFALIFWWLPYQVWAWGGYALLAGAVAALPATRLALAAADLRSRALILPALAAMAGLLFVHPSQLFLTLAVAAVVSATFALSRLTPPASAAVFAALVAAAAGALVAGDMLWQPVGDFMQRARDVSEVSASDPRYRWPVAAFFDLQMPRPPAFRTAIAILAAIGAIAAAVTPRLRPLLVLHLVFGGLVLAARYQAWITALWYHLPERIWYGQMASQPMLAALGIAAGLRVIASAAGRWIDLARWQLVAWPAAMWIVFVPMHERFEQWADWRLYHAVYRNPNFAITDRRLLADFAWMRANIPQGQLLFNAPGDWGLSLPFTGHRTVFWSGGTAFDPSTRWAEWLDLMQRGEPYISHAATELSARGVQYVYAARLNPALERRGRASLDPSRLREAAALTERYVSDTAVIFEIPGTRESLLGLHDSTRIRFEGFHPIEEEGRQRWRWTNGAGRLTLSVPPGAPGSCFVRVLGSDPAAYDLRQDGRVLPLSALGHRVALDGGPAVVVDVLSKTFVPDPTGGDTRTLGVRVTDVAFRCRP